jgi:hypothetical protein
MGARRPRRGSVLSRTRQAHQPRIEVPGGGAQRTDEALAFGDADTVTVSDHHRQFLAQGFAPEVLFRQRRALFGQS